MGSKAVGFVAVLFLPPILGGASLAFFYFQIPVVFILIGILIYIRLFFSVVIGWEVINLFLNIAPLIYVNLFLLSAFALFYSINYSLAEYIVGAILIIANCLLFMASRFY